MGFFQRRKPRQSILRITTADGQPMEMHPRPVDILVVRPIGESRTAGDSQFDAAVKELLSEVDARKKR
jgi:tricorn protease